MEKTFFEWTGYILEKYGVLFLQGAGVTLLVAVLGTILGSLVGLLVGVVRTIPRGQAGKMTFRRVILKIVNGILVCYIEFFRGTPMMVQAILVYFGLKEVLNIDLSSFTAGLLVISINTGAYMSEVVRGGIQSIDPGQYEAAQAIGMTHFQTMLHVILPQAIRNILPATGNEFVINIKDSAVLNVISVTELFFQAKTVKGIIFRTYETFLIASLIYLVLTLTVTRILRVIEKKMAGPSSYVLQSDALKQHGRTKGDM